MKKAMIIISCALIVSGVIAWTTYSWLSNASAKAENPIEEKEKQVTEKEIQKNREKLQGNITEEDLAAFQEQNLNPFGEETVQSQLDDYIYQEYIHGMSHQKVEANKKWGFYEIHPSRISWLLDGLTEVDLIHEDVYQTILEKWRINDFSSVDDDHNSIWNLQNGTVGKATGILSTEEEQAYINNNS